MYTLDASRKTEYRKSISFNPKFLHPIESNGSGIFILQDGNTDVYWMSVPQRSGGVKLYPMKATQ